MNNTSITKLKTTDLSIKYILSFWKEKLNICKISLLYFKWIYKIFLLFINLIILPGIILYYIQNNVNS